MRKIESHRCLLPPDDKGNQQGVGFNELVMIEAMDEVPEDEANAKYAFSLKAHGVWSSAGRIEFHRGPMRERLPDRSWRDNPPVGISNEALLAIVLDRLIAFQRGPLSCGSNDRAILHVTHALEALKGRTLGRVDRKVEGTLQP